MNTEIKKEVNQRFKAFNKTKSTDKGSKEWKGYKKLETAVQHLFARPKRTTGETSSRSAATANHFGKQLKVTRGFQNLNISVQLLRTLNKLQMTLRSQT